MKRIIAAIISGLLLTGVIVAQSGETLTNSAIIKMVKARLSDEIVIDVIRTSPVKFELDDSAIRSLASQNVSTQVIEAMKTSAKSPAPAARAMVPEQKQQAAGSERTAKVTSVPPVTVQRKEMVPTVQVVDAPGYIAPVKELVTFYENEFKSMTIAVSDWDKQIRNSIEEANDLNEQILQIETELRAKKNADANMYSPEILSLKKKLAEYREKYKQLKNKMLADSEKIKKSLSDMSSDKVNEIGKKYDEVGQRIKSAKTDPSAGENAEPVTFTQLMINDDVSGYIAPAAEMFYWHQNEIDELQRIIEKWAPRVREVVQKDAELRTTLEPINSKLEVYKAKAKMYKTEIAALKKQSAEIEKERKLLANQMEKDSQELSSLLKEDGKKIQNSVKERFTDIIENIAYVYLEKLHI